MVYLIIGGSGSGKSEFAENCCEHLTEGKKMYIATMEPHDAESYVRIGRHRNMRAGKGFDTLECYTHLEEARVPAGSTVLLECLSNLAANEMFSEKGRKDTAADVISEGIRILAHKTKNLVIVTNEVFSDGVEYEEGSEEYRRVLAEVNAEAAEMADTVCEVVHGIPVLVKGHLPDEELYV